MSDKEQYKSEAERIEALEVVTVQLQESVGELLNRESVQVEDVETVSDEVQLVRQPHVVQYYTFPASTSLVLDSTRAATPVGSASDQCYQFTIKNAKIKGTHTTELANDGDCVVLQSGAAEDGEATFVVCCKKEDGKCKQCDASPQLQVKNGDKFVVTKKVSITCRKV